MSRSYGVDDEIDMSELDDELAAIDEQLAIEEDVSISVLCASSGLCLRSASPAAAHIPTAAAATTDGAHQHKPRCTTARAARFLILSRWARRKCQHICRTMPRSPQPLCPLHPLQQLESKWTSSGVFTLLCFVACMFSAAANSDALVAAVRTLNHQAPNRHPDASCCQLEPARFPANADCLPSRSG